jgi:hypothetical protein
MNDIQISEKYFLKFKELMRKKVGDEEYNKMTEQELFDSATKLVTLMNAVVKHKNKEKA